MFKSLLFRRPHSPKGRKSAASSGQQHDSSSSSNNKSPHQQDLNFHVRQVKNSLKFCKDVISKNKLEMLHGNGTVVLESIANIHAALKAFKLNEHSSTLISATQQVHYSLGKLIKLCDQVLLSENGENCEALSVENAREIIELVENAVDVSEYL